MVNREVDSTSPPDPRCPIASFGSDPPDTAKPNPVGTPGGVSGIWSISATVLGSYHPSFRGGGGGSGLGSQTAEPFAAGCPAVTQRGPWVRYRRACGSSREAGPSAPAPIIHATARGGGSP